jgi:hypothetical protein
MKIRHKLWLEKNDRVIFGPGRFELLEAIEECRRSQRGGEEAEDVLPCGVGTPAGLRGTGWGCRSWS